MQYADHGRLLDVSKLVNDRAFLSCRLIVLRGVRDRLAPDVGRTYRRLSSPRHAAGICWDDPAEEKIAAMPLLPAQRARQW
jgi:hypothetical protein